MPGRVIDEGTDRVIQYFHENVDDEWFTLLRTGAPTTSCKMWLDAWMRGHGLT